MHEIANEHMLENILSDNEDLAKHNQQHFDELNLWTVNIMSAPGAGKTSLLEATLLAVKDQYQCGVIEGDMVGELDKLRLSKMGVSVWQICTGRSCHLDAKMVAGLLHTEKLANLDILFVENVGNLVCPAEFPLGEHKRVVLLSVTEGDDKPIKYPVIFRNCDCVIITKTDLLAYVDFKIDKAVSNIRALNANAKIFTLSVTTGEGMPDWLNWLKSELKHYWQSNKAMVKLQGKANVSVSTS